MTTQSAENTADIFLKNLRSGTGPMHVALEANPVSASLMDPDLSMAGYIRYLALMAEVISFTEKVIFPAVSDIVTDVDQRRKLPAIHHDLSVLAATPSAAPVFHPDATAFTVPFAMGYMYVTEGSTLGGRVILKHVQEKLQIDEAHGAGFFAGYGADTGVKWKTFLATLTRYAQHSGNGEEIIKGAQHAFAAIDRYFADNSQYGF